MRATCLAVAILVGGTGCNRSPEAVVLHAASLRRVMAEAAAEYQKANPNVRIRLEPSGSQVAIRKVTEQSLGADLVAVADAQLIGEMMIPGHASWYLEFATNEVVLAHLQHSKFTDEITASNWPEVLSRPAIRLGRVNPDTAPLGYHTLFAWQLAEKSGALGEAARDLAQRLVQAVPKERLATDESELLGLLEARGLDYAFLYRSTAEDHHLKVVLLPPETNLAKPELSAGYAAAAVEVRMKEGKVTLTGHPIAYGVTIPAKAPNAAEGERFLAFLLGARGQEIQRAAGFQPRKRPQVRGPGPVPITLRALTAPVPSKR